MDTDKKLTILDVEFFKRRIRDKIDYIWTQADMVIPTSHSTKVYSQLMKMIIEFKADIETVIAERES